MNLRDLEYFLAVVDLAHFGHAAERCNVSQPTLSGQIKKLEQELGVILFERTNRRVMVTDTGAEIARVARRINSDVSALRETARNSRDPFASQFRLGAFPTLASYLFPTLVTQIKKQKAKLQLILVEEKTATLLEQLKGGEIDAAFLALPVDDEMLETQKVFADEFLLAVPKDHPLSSLAIVDQTVLSDHPIMLLDEGHCMRDQALEVCQINSFAHAQDFKATSLETLRQMVKVGTGITLMPAIAINKQDKDIKFLEFKKPVPQREIALVWRKTTARKVIINHLLDLFS